MDKDRNDFGTLLRAIRESRKMSQTELAEKVGIDQSHLNKIEKGIRNPSKEVLFRLADVLVAEELFTAAGMLVPPEFKKKYQLKEPIKFPQVEYPQTLENIRNIYSNEFHKVFHERLHKEDEIRVFIKFINSNYDMYRMYEEAFVKAKDEDKDENLKSLLDTGKQLNILYDNLQRAQEDLAETFRYLEGEAAGKIIALEEIWKEIQRNIEHNLSGFLQDFIKLDKSDAEFIADIINMRKSKNNPIVKEKPPTVEQGA